jgi:hypothetical protein
MADSDQAEGPQVGQVVLYYDTGVTPNITPAVIYAVAAAGTVSLVYFNASGATNVTGKIYDNTQSKVGSWSYMLWF